MKNGKAMSGRIIHFNDFIDIDENVTTAEMTCIQEIAAEIEHNANADESDYKKM